MPKKFSPEKASKRAVKIFKNGVRDTGDFQKVEVPNPTVAKSIAKIEKAYKPVGSKVIPGSKEDKDAVTTKDWNRFMHWKNHQVMSSAYSHLNQAGVGAGQLFDGRVDKNGDPAVEPQNEAEQKLHDGYKHYKDNLDADQDTYDDMLSLTGGNGEHNK